MSHPWDKPSYQIASEIADQFFLVTSLQHTELIQQIEYRIECEREVAYHYLMQMGRWVNEARKKGILR
jgi:hypothetical protein